MGGGDADWDWLKASVASAAEAFGEQLLMIDDTSVQVPNLEWTVGELAAHLISLPALYRDQHALAVPFEIPADFATFSRSVRAHITETDSGALAALLRSEIDGYLDELGSDPGAPRTLYNQATTAANMAAGTLAELLVHGQDLGRLTGARITIDRRQALVIVEQLMVLAPAFVDRDRARRCDGTFHLRFRGGGDFTYRIDDGVLTVEEGRPAKADGHIVADPLAFLLSSLGRMSQARAALTGKIIAYGTKPLLLGRLSSIRIDGV